MEKKAELHYEGQVFEIPVVTGTENENALDISKLRVQSGFSQVPFRCHSDSVRFQSHLRAILDLKS